MVKLCDGNAGSLRRGDGAAREMMAKRRTLRYAAGPRAACKIPMTMSAPMRGGVRPPSRRWRLHRDDVGSRQEMWLSAQPWLSTVNLSGQRSGLHSGTAVAHDTSVHIAVHHPRMQQPPCPFHAASSCLPSISSKVCPSSAQRRPKDVGHEAFQGSSSTNCRHSQPNARKYLGSLKSDRSSCFRSQRRVHFDAPPSLPCNPPSLPSNPPPLLILLPNHRINNHKHLPSHPLKFLPLPLQTPRKLIRMPPRALHALDRHPRKRCPNIAFARRQCALLGPAREVAAV